VPPRRALGADVVFDDLAFSDDVQRAGGSGRAVALATRKAYEADGCPVDELYACDAEARDSTSLPGCVKVYLPAPAGRFGMVFSIERCEGRLMLAFLAFGVRHQPRNSNAPTVYQLAHRRLHDKGQS
jgi:hypothetical protein